MPQKSPYRAEIPAISVLDYLLPADTLPSTSPLWIDAKEPSSNLSQASLLLWVKRLGLGLQTAGMKKGDVVLVYSSNHILVPVVYLAVPGAGGIFSGCNTAYGVEETAFQIRDTGARFVLVEPQYLTSMLNAARKTNFPNERILLFSDKPCLMTDGPKDFRSILAPVEEAGHWRWRSLSSREAKETVAVLNYSSGTTGLPKGVMITHQNVVANTVQSIYMRDLEQSYTPDTRPLERWLGFLPLYHAYGQLWSVVAACKTNSRCYMMRTFIYSDFLSHIQTHQITHIQTAPPVLVMLAKRPETVQYDLSSLQNILCGAAPLSRELQNEVSARCRLSVVQTWGMTEVTCSCLHVPGGADDRSGSVGLIDPGAEMKLVDDDGREVGPGERGEIYVRGPNVCLGYWRNEQATTDTFGAGGFLKTGDVAVRNEEGWFWVVDRKKELIKVKGFQVAPAELEALLLKHEGIADAAVVALNVDHEELPRAYVCQRDSARGKLSEAAVVSWMADRVAEHKQLRGGVAFIDEVPKSASGKIQRKIMREWAEKDAAKLRQPARAKL